MRSSLDEIHLDSLLELFYISCLNVSDRISVGNVTCVNQIAVKGIIDEYQEQVD